MTNYKYRNRIRDLKNRIKRIKSLNNMLLAANLSRLKKRKKELDKIPIEKFNSNKYSVGLNYTKQEIPVSRIVGIDRFQKYENFGEIISVLIEGNMNDPVFKIFKIDSLIELYMENQKKFFDLLINPKTSIPSAVYDLESDKYYIDSDGSHRAFLAKLLNLDRMTVNVSKLLTVKEVEKELEEYHQKLSVKNKSDKRQ